MSESRVIREGDFVIGPDVDLPLVLWKEIVKYRAGWACEDCGTQFVPNKRLKPGENQFHAHHIDGNRSNNVLQNGAALCKSCHAERHRQMPPRDTAEERSARTRASWETRRRTGAVNSRFARMTAEELSEKNKRSAANSPARERDEQGRYK